jgi:DNA-binding XRE family transcriptional regulator
MKSLDQYIKKLPARERAAIAAGASRKIAALRLQQARVAAGLTQEEVAERLGVTQATLSRMEHRPDVKISNIRRYVEALGGRLQIRAVFARKHKTIELGA